jgi:hypothetical protein
LRRLRQLECGQWIAELHDSRRAPLLLGTVTGQYVTGTLQGFSSRRRAGSVGQSAARKQLFADAKAGGESETLVEFIRRSTEGARRLIIGRLDRFGPELRSNDFILHPGRPHAYHFDSCAGSFAFDPETFSHDAIATLPRSLRRTIQETSIFILDIAITLRHTGDIIGALSFDNRAADLAMFIAKDADELTWQGQDQIFFLLVAKLSQIFKNRVALFTLNDGWLVHCSQIDVKLFGRVRFEDIESYFSPVSEDDLFTHFIPRPQRPPANPTRVESDGRVEVINSQTFSELFSPQIERLQSSATTPFPPPRWSLDLSGRDMRDALAQRQTIATGESAIYGLNAHALVRGTNAILIAPDRLIFTRQLDLQTAGALMGYLKTGCDWLNQAESFHSGLFFSGETMVLGEKEARLLDDHCFIATPDEYLNYGMWLLQAVPVLYHVETANIQQALLCPYALEWQQSIVNFVAPNASKRVVNHEPRYDYVSSGTLSFIGSSERSFYINSLQKAAFAHLRDRAISHCELPTTSKRIYVSRYRQSSPTFSNRVLVNEIELIIGLQRLGFAIVTPESLDFPTQIQIFSQADVVIGPGGAGMFNCVFCRPGATVITIESNAYWISNHCILFGSLDLDYAVVFGQQLDPSAGPHSAWRLDVDEFLSHLTSTKIVSA